MKITFFTAIILTIILLSLEVIETVQSDELDVRFYNEDRYQQFLSSSNSFDFDYYKNNNGLVRIPIEEEFVDSSYSETGKYIAIPISNQVFIDTTERIDGTYRLVLDVFVANYHTNNGVFRIGVNYTNNDEIFYSATSPDFNVNVNDTKRILISLEFEDIESDWLSKGIIILRTHPPEGSGDPSHIFYETKLHVKFNFKSFTDAIKISDNMLDYSISKNEKGLDQLKINNTDELTDDSLIQFFYHGDSEVCESFSMISQGQTIQNFAADKFYTATMKSNTVKAFEDIAIQCNPKDIKSNSELMINAFADNNTIEKENNQFGTFVLFVAQESEIENCIGCIVVIVDIDSIEFYVNLTIAVSITVSITAALSVYIIRKKYKK